MAKADAIHLLSRRDEGDRPAPPQPFGPLGFIAASIVGVPLAMNGIASGPPPR